MSEIGDIGETAVRDQFLAATTEAQALFRADRRPVNAGPPGTITKLVSRRWANAIGNFNRHCGHMDNPRPAHAHANMLGAMWCVECWPHAPVPPWRCSACGCFAARMAEGCALLGPVMLSYLLCPDCEAAEG